MVTVVSVVSGCAERDADEGSVLLDHGPFHPVLIAGSVVNESPIIGMPADVALADTILWINDAAGDPSLHAIDARTGNLLKSLGRRGDGPGEFHRSAFGLSRREMDRVGSMWAFDMSLQRLSLFDVDLAGPNDVRTVSLPGVNVTRVLWMGPNRIIGIQGYEDARVVRFDSLGSVEAVVPGPVLGDSTLPRDVRRSATISAFQICGRANRGFTIVYFMVGRVDLFDPDGVYRHSASVPFSSDARHTFNEARDRWFQIRDRMWYLSCTTTDDHIYALFSGRSVADTSEQGGRFVHVFEWEDGAFLRAMELEEAVQSITISPDGLTLFGSSTEDAKTYRFDLRGVVPGS